MYSKITQVSQIILPNSTGSPEDQQARKNSRIPGANASNVPTNSAKEFGYSCGTPAERSVVTEDTDRPDVIHIVYANSGSARTVNIENIGIICRSRHVRGLPVMPS